MTYSTENLFQSGRLTIAVDLRAAVAAALARIACQYRVYQTTRLLSALDDRALHDIGLDRCQIFQVARHAATATGHHHPR